MAFANPDLKLVSNCGRFTVQVFNGMFQINKLTTEGAFLKLGRISPSEFTEIVLPLINTACKAINNAPKEPDKPKTITKKQDKSKDLKCPFKRPDNNLTIGRDFGLYNVCNLHCQITKECKIVCESLQTPIVEPVKIEPIKPVKIEPIKSVTPAVTPTKTDKLSSKSRIHMIGILKSNGVKIAKNITDSALRILYADLKG